MSAAQGGTARTMKRLVLGALHAYEHRSGHSPSPAPELWDMAVDDAGHLSWDGCALDHLAGQFGTPLHVVSLMRLRRNFRRFHSAFATRYPHTRVAYSYKTNPVPGVLQALHETGADAEVISHYELWLALELGVPPGRIIFNGPAKTPAAIDLAVSRGIKLINIDGEAEIAMVQESASRHGRRQRVGLRVLASLGWSGQFGFRLEDGALAAFRRMGDCPDLDPCGLHLHLGTGVQDTKLYFDAGREVFRFAARLHQELGVRIRHFDLGGGFGVPTVRQLSAMELRYLDQGLPLRAPRPQDVPAIEDCAAGIIALAEEFISTSGLAPPEIILEPGRAITSSAQCLLVRVLSCKARPDGSRAAVADGGRNLAVPLGYEYHELFAAGRMNDASRVRHTVYGPLCHPSDIIAAHRDLPLLEAGDVLAVMDAGAYFIANQTNFSHPRPAVVMIADGAARLIRRPECFQDMVRLDAAPGNRAVASGEDEAVSAIQSA